MYITTLLLKYYKTIKFYGLYCVKNFLTGSYTRFIFVTKL